MQGDAASRVEFEGDATLHVFQEPNLRALTFAAVCGDGCNMLLAFQIPVTHTHACTHICTRTHTRTHERTHTHTFTIHYIMRNTKYKNIIIIIIHVPERPHNCIIIQCCWVLQKNLLRVQRGTECYPNHTSDSDILVLTEIHKSATTKNAIESTQNTVLYMSLCLRMMPTPSSATDGNIRYICKIHVNHL